jgi:hypothetical protein
MLQRYSPSGGIAGSTNCSMMPNPLGDWIRFQDASKVQPLYPHDDSILEIEKAVIQDSLLRIQGALREIADSPLIAMDLMQHVTQGLTTIAGEVTKLQKFLTP